MAEGVLGGAALVRVELAVAEGGRQRRDGEEARPHPASAATVRRVSGSRPAARAASAPATTASPTPASWAVRAARAPAASGSSGATPSRSERSSVARRRSAVRRSRGLGRATIRSRASHRAVDVAVAVLVVVVAVARPPPPRPRPLASSACAGGPVMLDQLRSAVLEELADELAGGPFWTVGPPCVARTSVSRARVIATYRSRRSSSVWMSPTGTPSRSSSFGKRLQSPARTGHSPSRRCGTKTWSYSRPLAW